MFLKKNILFFLSQKKLIWLMWNPKATVKFNLMVALKNKYQINYFLYFYISRKFFKYILKKTKIFGIATPSFYNFSSQKKQKLSSKNLFKIKLLSWKDNRFFFGIVLKIKKRFLNSTITIRNVFYNEIIEKTFFLFNVWNTVSQSLNISEVKQNFFKKSIKKKSNYFFLWSYPWSYSKVLLNL